MESSRNRASIIASFWQLVFIVAFIVLAAFLVASANGYLFNRDTRQLQQTGIINLTVQPMPVSVTLNGKTKQYSRQEIGLTYLLPGRYSVVVTKPGYTTWFKNVTLSPLQVDLNPFVTLFLADVKPRQATDAEIQFLSSQEATPLTFTDLDIRANEIWAKPIARTYPFAQSADRFNLVARLSSPILKATWFEGRNRVHTHIIYQYGHAIHVIDRDGSNDLILAELTQDTPAAFAVDNQNEVLIYRDGDQVWARELQ